MPFSFVKLIQVLQGSGQTRSEEAEAVHINPFPHGNPQFRCEHKSPNGFHITPPRRLGYTPRFNAPAQSKPPAVVSSRGCLNTRCKSVSPAPRKRCEKSQRSGVIPEHQPLSVQGRGEGAGGGGALCNFSLNIITWLHSCAYNFFILL